VIPSTPHVGFTGRVDDSLTLLARDHAIRREHQTRQGPEDGHLDDRTLTTQRRRQQHAWRKLV
jgi:hypothetical protein